MRSLVRGFCQVFVALALVCAAARADASSLSFVLGTPFTSVDSVNNTPASTSTAPYGTLTFTDLAPIGSSPQVQMTITASLENQNEWFRWLGFSGPYTSAILQFTLDSSSKVGTFTNPTVGSGNNNVNFQPPAGFDYLVTFPEANAAAGVSNAAINFDNNDSVSYRISCVIVATCGTAGTLPLSALGFNLANVDNSHAGYGGWYALVWLGYPGTPLVLTSDGYAGARYGDNTPADNIASAAAVPEPASLLLLGTGLAVARARRRR